MHAATHMATPKRGALPSPLKPVEERKVKTPVKTPTKTAATPTKSPGPGKVGSSCCVVVIAS